MHLWIRTIFCVFASMWLIALGATLRADPELMATLPFVANSGDIPIVEIQLSDTCKGIFLVDTGTNFSMISDTMTRRLNILPKPLGPEDSNHKDKLLGIVDVPTVKIGQRSFRIEFTEVRAKDLATDTPFHLDGIIGLDVLKDSGVLFDFKNRQVKIWNAGHVSNSLLNELGMLDKQSFFMHNASPTDFQFTVSVELNKQVTNEMLLDTGAASTGISSERVNQLHLKRSGLVKDFTSLGSKTDVELYHLDALHLGVISIVDLDVVREPEELWHAKNIIGRPILSKFQVLFDFPAKMVYFRPILPLVSPLPKKYAWTVAYKQNQSFSEERTIAFSGTFADGKVHSQTQVDRLDCLVKEVAPDGKMTLQINSKSISLDLDGKLQPVGPESNMTSTQILSRQGRSLIGSQKDVSDNIMFRALFMLENQPVPDHPVAIGETWNTILDSQTDPGKQITMISTLVGKETVEGQTTLKVHIFTQIPLKDFPEDTIFVEEYYYITPETGQLVKSECTLSNINVSFVTVPGEQVKGTFVLKKRLLPATTDPAPGKPDGK